MRGGRRDGADGRSEPLHQMVYEALKRGILTGELRVGEFVSEAELARRWNVSRTPIREAIRQIERESLVTWSPRRGARVAGLGPNTLRDLYELRETLEALAARLTAERGSDEDIEELGRLQETIADAHARGDLVDALNADDAFHRRLALTSRNQMLVRSWGRSSTAC